jgi:hypothetical protein
MIRIQWILQKILKYTPQLRISLSTVLSGSTVNDPKFLVKNVVNFVPFEWSRVLFRILLSLKWPSSVRKVHGSGEYRFPDVRRFSYTIVDLWMHGHETTILNPEFTVLQQSVYCYNSEWRPILRSDGKGINGGNAIIAGHRSPGEKKC